jgi:hypothetical protein
MRLVTPHQTFLRTSLANFKGEMIFWYKWGEVKLGQYYNGLGLESGLELKNGLKFAFTNNSAKPFVFFTNYITY